MWSTISFTFLRFIKSLIPNVLGQWGVPWVTFLVLNKKYWKSQQCHQNSWIDSCWDALGGVSESGFFYDVSQHYRTKLDKWKIYHLNKHLYQTLFTKIIQASENGWHYLFQFRKKENKTIKTGFTSVSQPRSTLVVPCPPVRWGWSRFAGAWQELQPITFQATQGPPFSWQGSVFLWRDESLEISPCVCVAGSRWSNSSAHDGVNALSQRTFAYLEAVCPLFWGLNPLKQDLNSA